jgi:hypothetical protein
MNLIFSNDKFVFGDNYIIAGYENDIVIYQRRHEVHKESYARQFQQMLNRKKNIYVNNLRSERCVISYLHDASFHYKHVNLGLCHKCNDVLFSGNDARLNDSEQRVIKELLPDKWHQDIYVAIRGDECVIIVYIGSYWSYTVEFSRINWTLFDNRVEIDGQYDKIIDPQIFSEVMERKY